MFIKVIKFLLYLFGFILLAIFSVFVSLFLHLSLWYSFTVFFGIIIVYFFGKWFFVRFIRYVRKKGVLQDKSNHDEQDDKLEETYLNALLRSKKHNKMHKKKLPWFLLIGSLGSGKSSLVNGTNVYSFDKGMDKNSSILSTGTGQCWSLDGAVIAEVSGGIFNAKVSKPAYKAWKNIVNKIASKKKNISLKGIIITLSIEELMSNPEDLVSYALKLRQKVEYFCHKSNYTYPIYLILTKADRLQGFSSFAQGLPDIIREQVLGQLFEQNKFHLGSKLLVDKWGEELTDRINSFNTMQVQANGTIEPSVLLFQNNILNLKKPLTDFLTAFFRIKSNNKRDNPVIRGLFLTSSKQEGGSSDIDKGSVIESLELSELSTGSSQALFIHNIFNVTLPNDYSFIVRFSKIDEAKKRYYKIALTAWWLFFVGGSAYLGVAYTNAMEALMEIQEATGARSDQFGNKLDLNILLMSGMSQDIQSIQKIKNKWFLLVEPYSSSLDSIEAGYKQYYVKQFNSFVSPQLASILNKKALELSGNGENKHFGFVVESLVERINLIQSRLDLIPQDRASFMVVDDHSLLLEDFSKNQYGFLYEDYIAWNDNFIELKKRRGQLLKLLDSLDLYSNTMPWVEGWVDEVTDINPIKSVTYFPSNKYFPNDDIAAAFTQSGYRLIRSLFLNLANSQLQPTVMEQYLLKISAAYELKRYNAWEKFTNDFSLNVMNFPSEAAWYASSQSNLFDNTFSLYASTIKENFTDKMLVKNPEWLRLFYTLYEYRNFARLSLLSEKKEVSWFGKIVNYVNLYTNAFNDTISNKSYDKNLTDAIKKYEETLLDIQKIVLQLDQKSSLDMIMALYSKARNKQTDDKKNDKGLFYKAYNEFDQIKFYAASIIKLVNKDSATWNLMRGSLDLYFHGVINKAMCEISEKWDSDVLERYRSGTGSLSTLEGLLGNKSLVSKFVQENIIPFMVYSNTRNRYVPKQIYGHQLSFPSFTYQLARAHYLFVNLRMQQDRIQVILKEQQDVIEIEMKPVNLNKKAKLLADSISLSIVCGDKKEIFTNYAMVSHFVIPNDIFSCTSAELSVNFNGVEHFSAVKKYSGTRSLLKLISDFGENGQKIFQAKEFSNVYSELQNYDINQLTVFIDFSILESIKSKIKTYTDDYFYLSSLIDKELTSWQYLNITSCWSDSAWSDGTWIHNDNGENKGSNVMRWDADTISQGKESSKKIK